MILQILSRAGRESSDFCQNGTKNVETRFFWVLGAVCGQYRLWSERRPPSPYVSAAQCLYFICLCTWFSSQRWLGASYLISNSPRVQLPLTQLLIILQFNYIIIIDVVSRPRRIFLTLFTLGSSQRPRRLQLCRSAAVVAGSGVHHGCPHSDSSSNNC